jgi:hypothetical protein
VVVRRLSRVAPNPGTVNSHNPIIFRYYSQLSSTWAPLGVTGVVQSLFYHVCFVFFWCRRGYWGSLGIVTDGANVLSVRSRTTRSSKGKASLIFHCSTWTFNLILSSFFSLHRHPLTCFPLPPPLLSTSPAPFRPRCQHPTTHGTTPSAWPLRG